MLGSVHKRQIKAVIRIQTFTAEIIVIFQCYHQHALVVIDVVHGVIKQQFFSEDWNEILLGDGFSRFRKFDKQRFYLCPFAVCFLKCPAI